VEHRLGELTMECGDIYLVMPRVVLLYDTTILWRHGRVLHGITLYLPKYIAKFKLYTPH